MRVAELLKLKDIRGGIDKVRVYLLAEVGCNARRKCPEQVTALLRVIARPAETLKAPMGPPGEGHPPK